jgi:hypothetical protein
LPYYYYFNFVGGATLKYIVKLVAIREPALNEVLLRTNGQMDGLGEGRISPDMEEAYEKFVKGSSLGKNVFADIGQVTPQSY